MRKTVLLAVMLLSVGAGPAFAQTETQPPYTPPPSRCEATPATPVAPDGATATAEAMASAVADYETWRQTMLANLACRHSEATELRAAADARTAEYNTANSLARETGAAFQAATEVYNARRPNRRN